MKKLEYIIFLQIRLKFILFCKKKIINDINLIDEYLKQIMINNKYCYNNNLINNFVYTNNNNEISKVLTILDNIDNQLIFKNLNLLEKIKKNMISLINNVGLKNIDYIIKIIYNKEIVSLFNNKELTNQLTFINLNFNPTSCYCFNTKPNNNNKNLIIYDTKIIDKYKFNINDLNNVETFLITHNIKNKQSLNENLNGAIIYLKINKQILVINGYFNNYYLNLLSRNKFIKNKIIELEDRINYLNINNEFKKNYIKQLSLRDLVVLTTTEITNNFLNYYKLSNIYKTETISFIVKDFLGKDLINQRNILVMLLLMKHDPNLHHIAYLLYDLISNDSYLLKAQPFADLIYDTLHWTIQKDFKCNLKIFNEKINKSISINEIDYEKRINLLNCEDKVKSKAFDKLKEISNKSNDNSSKAQYYLDSLLKIPFKIYKKEEIFCNLEFIGNKFLVLINKLNDVIDCNSIKHYLDKEKLQFYDIEFIIRFIEPYMLLSKTQYSNILYGKLIDYVLQKNLNTLNNIIDKKFKTKKQHETYFLNNKNSIIITKIKSLYNLEIIDDKILLKEIENIITEWCLYKENRIKYINNVDKILSKAIYSQNDAKIEIKRILAQWMNGKMNGYCLGFEGPPGVGKTSLAKKGISKCLLDSSGNTRPFSFIALGGSCNGSILEGHNYTYVGSNYGKIVDILIETQCMNPIIYIDELDKVSNTENGKEIIGILTHLTDFSQNDMYNDKYFSGINLDLSKVLFIFSYNDFSKLDPILADRIHRIKFNYLDKPEKIHIMNNYIIPELLDNVGLKKENIIIEKDILNNIIDSYTYEGGVRKLKERVFEIIRQINLDLITNKKSKKNIKVSLKYIDNLFKSKSKIENKVIDNINRIGYVNGLFATSIGIGGITVIQCSKIYNDTKFGLTITGQQGDIMKESVQCAKTLVWNLLPKNIKQKIIEEWKNSPFGIHIHCPEASTPKDGPSAGAAITLCIISLLCKINVINNIALTGEIDIKGKITKIGGLDLKIFGGKTANIKKILIPKDNENDYLYIKKYKPHILENIEIKIVNHINEVIKICLESNDLDFNFKVPL